MARKVVLAGACRTAIGVMGGQFANTSAVELGTIVIKEALKRAGVSPDQVDEVYMGNVIQAGNGQNPARQAAVYAGIPNEVPATTINVLCGSGLHCVNLAAKLIAAGDADIIVAGPKPISGTAALVGIFEAYEAMTGEAVQDNVVDAALNELVVTGELEASIQGLTDQEVEEFIAYIKSLIAEKGLTDEKSINEAIDEACDKYGVTLSDDERQKIVDLLLKITSLGIDLSGLVDYAASLYNSFKNGGSSSGIMASIGNFFGNIFSAIGEFFKNLFK